MLHSKIADVLGAKGSEVYAVDMDAMVDLAVERMTTLRVGALLVLDHGKPVGLLSERDILRRVVYLNRSPRETRVGAVMTRDPLTVKSTANVADAMHAITVHRCRHLPVVDDRRVVGLVSIGDLTAWVTRELQAELSEFARYIHGQYISDSVSSPAPKSPTDEVSPAADSTMAL